MEGCGSSFTKAMIKAELSHAPFVEIDRHGEKFYGGSQQWSSDERLCGFGCGAAALANYQLYMDKARHTEADEFIMLMERNAEHIKADADGIVFMLGWRKCTGKLPKYYPAGLFSLKKAVSAAAESLEKDIPVTMAVYMPKKYPSYMMYDAAGGSSAAIRAHYMTVTGISEESDAIWLIISSWGKRYRLNMNEVWSRARGNFLSAFGTCFFVP